MRQCAFIGTSYRAILHLLSSQPSPTFSLFTRRIPPLSAVFHSSLSPRPSSFLFLPSVRTYDSSYSFEHRANYFLSGSVESYLVSLTSILFPFLHPCPSSFRNLDGYRPLLIFTIRGAIFPSFHPTVIKWAFLIVSDTKDRILEVFFFISVVSDKQSITQQVLTRY